MDRKQPQIKVYMTDVRELDDPVLFHRFYSGVSRERQEKIDRLRRQEDKKRSLAAEVLLMAALKREKGESADALRFSYGACGKPYLEGPENNYYFNLSHSGSRVLCALAETEVGCDVEQISGRNWKCAERFLTQQEADWIRQNTRCGEKLAPGQTEAYKSMLCRLWTLKESFVKNIGTGITSPLHGLSFFMENDQITVCQKINRGNYYFKEYDLHDGYRYAVCGRIPNFSELEKIRLSDVIFSGVS